MSNFDDWRESQRTNINGYTERDAYKAGVASRQAEVDELQAKINSLNKNIDSLHIENERIQKQYQMMFEGVQGRQQTINELQKRIDEIKKAVLSLRNEFNLWSDDTDSFHVIEAQIEQLEELLK